MIEAQPARNKLTKARVTELERSPTLPVWSRPALTETGFQGPLPSYRISISGLYWAVRRMPVDLRRTSHANAADQLAKQLEF